MGEMKTEDKKQSDKKGLLLGAGVITVLCVGILLGSVFQKTATPEYCLTDNATEETAEPRETEEIADKDMVYSTFSIPDAYFTFEYPSTWTYEKEDTALGEEYNETLYVFYTDADKKQTIFSLNYPMNETAMDTCLKFEEVTDYTHEHIATNDSGTFVNYMTCGATEYDSAESYWAGHSMGDIFWQRGVWDGDKTIDYDEKTQARIHWEDNFISGEIAGHIAHSIKINR